MLIVFNLFTENEIENNDNLHSYHRQPASRERFGEGLSDDHHWLLRPEGDMADTSLLDTPGKGNSF